MRAAGVELIKDIPQLNVIGVIGPRTLGSWVRRVFRVSRVLRHESLDLVVLIDQPGLNLHFARIAKQAGQRVVYYITPQVWAWRPRRMKWMQRRVDHAIVILPFEEALYRRAGVPCTFVGHPLLDDVAPSYDRNRLREQYGVTSDQRVLGLLPGSRLGEVQALLPLMLQAAQQLSRDYPMKILLAAADTVETTEISRLCHQAGVEVQLIEKDPSGVMAAADLLFVASGTATLQAAIIGTPMVIVYKVSPLVFLLAKLLVRVQSVGLANLIAGRPFIPELLQYQATPDRLVAEARRILEDQAYCDTMRAEMARVRSLLGEPGASQRAARVILQRLEQWRGASVG